jgi:hypothetical protein
VEPAIASDLAQRLREANAAELVFLLRGSAAQLGAADACQMLRNPFAGREVIEWLASEKPELFSTYALGKEVALHPHAPEILALRLIQGLFWQDLLRLVADVRLRPTLRRSAELRLIERLPAMAVGEKAVLARQASIGLLAVVRHDHNARVIEALLENPRLTEGVLLPLAASAEATPAALHAIASSARWGVRHVVRVALSRNPHLPVADALALLPGLTRAELRAVSADLRLAAMVRQRARLLLGE